MDSHLRVHQGFLGGGDPTGHQFGINRDLPPHQCQRHWAQVVVEGARPDPAHRPPRLGSGQ